MLYLTTLPNNQADIWLGIMGFFVLVISAWLAFATLTALLKGNKKQGRIYLVMMLVGAVYSLFRLFGVYPALGVAALIVYIFFGTYAYIYMKKKK